MTAYLFVIFIGFLLCVNGHWFIGPLLSIMTFILGLLIDFE